MTEPLRPSLVWLLQSCLALNEGEGFRSNNAEPGAARSATRTRHSGTGGAFTLGFFDAALYDGKSLYASARQGKNFLLVYSLLKEKRLGEKAKLSGVNVRSAWAFSLWGDPTLTDERVAPRYAARSQHKSQGRSDRQRRDDRAHAGGILPA